MAEFNRDNQKYNHFRDENSNTVILTDRYGHLSTGIEASSISAFGEPIAVGINPVIQLDGLYGLDSRKFETYNALGGAVSSTGTLMRCETGTSQYGYGVIRSRRAVRYRPGQGMLGRFTAKFTQVSTGIVSIGGTGTVSVEATSHLLSTGDYVNITGTQNFNGTFGPITVVDPDNFTFYASGNANTESTSDSPPLAATVKGENYAGLKLGVDGYSQRAGFFTQEQALQVGFDGKHFGVLRQNGGKAHIQEIQVLTVNTGEDVTVTLNDASVTFTTAATTAEEQAKEIYDALIGASPSFEQSWILEWHEDRVVALSKSVGPLAGAFTVSGNGSPAGTYTLTTLQSGVAHTTSWTRQNSFSLDKLDGTGPSGMVLDPSKLNVFQVNLRWLGAGRIQYAIEDPVGAMIPFHIETYANANEDVHLDNPSMKIGYVATSLGGSGKNVIVEGASIMGAIEGNINTTSFPASHSANKAGISTSVASHIFSIKNRLTFDNKINLREVLVKKLSAGITAQANTFGKVYLFLNPTNSVDHVWQDIGNNSHVMYSDVAGTVTVTDPLTSFSLFKDSPQVIDLEDLRIVVPPNNILTVAILISGGTSNREGDASLTWIED